MPFVGGVGPLEVLIILVIALLVFGPKRLPELGRSLGKGLREFKDSVSGLGRDYDEGDSKPEIESESGEASEASEAPLEGEVVHQRKP